MKIVRVKGGVGNQMFQYCFAKKMKQMTNDTVKIDMSSYQQLMDDPIRQPRLLKFNINMPIASDEEISKMRFFDHRSMSLGNAYKIKTGLEGLFNPKYFFEKNRAYIDPKSILKYSYFDGYWQSWRYLESMRTELMDEFTPKNELHEKTKATQARMQSQNSVFIGIRRGDYLAASKHFGSFGAEYYRKGMRYIFEHVDKPVFYIFSNDLPWVKENLDFKDAEVYFREDEDIVDDFEELILMSSCKHSLIGNSTFHWWGSWLIKNEEKIVLAPKTWFFDNKPIDIIPPDWIQIEE